MFAPPPRDTGGSGEKAKPGAGDNGLATNHSAATELHVLSCSQEGRAGGAWRAGGRGLGESHMHMAQCCRFKKSLEP